MAPGSARNWPSEVGSAERTTLDGLGFEVMREVAGADLEAVEKRGGLARLHLSGGEGVDDDRKGHLNRLAIFKGAEMDGLGADDGV